MKTTLHKRYFVHIDLGLHWNPATKELTMIGENPTIVVTADTDAANRLQAMKQQMSVQSSIDDIGINIGSLRNVQDTHLYEASTFYIDTDDADCLLPLLPLSK